MKYIKQYGIQRSGTNYMRAVFEMNTDCRVLANIGGWKHGKIKNKTNMSQVKTELSKSEIDKIDQMLAAKEIPTIAIIRNPYSWIPDIAKYLNQKISLNFIETQLTRYIELNSHWAEHCDYIIYFEELIRCPEKILQDCSRVLGIEVTKNQLVLPDKEMKRGGDVPACDNISSKPFDINYLLDDRYIDELTFEEKAYIQGKEFKMDFLNKPLVK